MKEIALSFTANLEISKVNKSLQTYNNAAFRMCKIAKEGNISWRAESDGEDGTKAIFSRTVSDKATFEITSPTTLEWSDRRGSYQITSSDSENIQKLYKILAEAQSNAGSSGPNTPKGKSTPTPSPRTVASPRTVVSPRTTASPRKSGSPRTGSNPISVPSPRTSDGNNDANWSSGTPPAASKPKIGERGRGQTFTTINRAGTDVPVRAESPKKRGNFLKRRQMSTSVLTTTPSGEEIKLPPPPSTPVPQSSIPVLKTDNSIRDVNERFFQTKISQAQTLASVTGPKGMRNISISPQYEAPVYLMEIILNDYDKFQFSFDKKLVPKQFARTIKTLSSSVDKRWILCPVLSWDELVKVKDIQSNGIKKNSDPYLIGEYLISLLRDLSPICSFENFEPKESFVEISGNEKKESQYLKQLLDSQPPSNKAIIGSLLQLSNNCIKHQNTNLLSAEQIAKLYGPYFCSTAQLNYKQTFPNSMASPISL